MSNTAEVIIVGGGVTGLCTAIQLAWRGVKRIVVLDRHYVGAGQSGRAAGIVRALVGHRDTSRWQLESIRFLSELPQRHNVDVTVNKTGYLLLVHAEETQLMQNAIESCIAAGGDAGCIDRAQALQLQPGIGGDESTSYAYESNAIHVDPMSVTQALAGIAREAGVQIIEGCEVKEILVKAGSVTGVEIAEGPFHAPTVMIALAAWAAALFRQLGIELPIQSHRAQMTFFHTPLASEHRVTRIVSDARTTLYLRPEGQRQMFVGWREGDLISRLEDCAAVDPNHYQQTADFANVAAMHQRLSQTLPFMAEGFIHRTYACAYDYSPDGMPILDRIDSAAGLYFAAGFSGGGFSLSPFVGRAMAQFIHEGQRPHEIEILSLRRFAEGRPIQWSNAGKCRDISAQTKKAPLGSDPRASTLNSN